MNDDLVLFYLRWSREPGSSESILLLELNEVVSWCERKGQHEMAEELRKIKEVAGTRGE